jgi:Fe-S oxidoreductase
MTALSGALLLGAIAVAAGIFARRALLLVGIVRIGKPSDRSGDTSTRARNEAVVVLGQRKLLQRLVPGLVHAFIFWGFVVLFPTILMAMLGAVDRDWSFPWLGSQGWFALMVDVFATLVLVGVVSAVWIRKVQRPERFKGSHLGEADLILAMIAGIVTTLLLWHASKIALGLNEWPPSWSPVSDLLAQLFGDGDATEVMERVLVWAHITLVLAFLAYLPHSKHLHIATAGINVWFGRTRARGRLEPLSFDEEDEAKLRFGSATVADMTWKQMIDTMSCTECGRCQDVCPAYATGKELSPKLLIMGLRDQLFAEGPKLLAASRGGEDFEPTALVGNAVSADVVWDCVTCGACVHECPVAIEHVDHIVDLRRQLVMVEASPPAESGPMLRDLERTSNPWGKAQTERADWTEGLDVRILQPGEPAPEVLYWVGCAASFDERARETARSTAKLLTAAQVDFAILGPRECCTGDPARRMGDEYTFQSYAQQNIETLNDANVKKIVASCPHCFNTLSNEYPDFGGSYEVVHHTELLAELLEQDRLEPVAGTDEITYHDSCYLARHNDVIAAPRALVSRIGKPLEMVRSGKRGFCCGAGGAHMWMEERGTAINEERAREAVATGASTLAVACPFCTVMLDDGVKQVGGDMRVADVATLLAEALVQPPATKAEE